MSNTKECVPYGEFWKEELIKMPKAMIVKLAAELGVEKNKYKDALIRISNKDEINDVFETSSQIAKEALS